MRMQASLDFDAPPRQLPQPAPTPLGETFVEALDGARLGTQLREIWLLMCMGGWWTLAELEAATGHPQASISARLRDIRRAGILVERRRRGEGGTWEYRVVR